MKPQLNEAVASLVQKSLDSFEKGATFLSEQLPEVVSQLLMWKFTQSLIYALIGLATLLVMVGIPLFAIWWCTRQVKCSRHASDEETVLRWDVLDAETVGAGLVGWLVLMLCMIPIAVSTLNFTWLQIWIAPKVFLIEYAARLIK